jgi:hypothetical protein
MRSKETCFPKEYKKFWEPYTKGTILQHLTTRENFKNIKEDGVLKPYDPAPKQWAGLAAVFLMDPDDFQHEHAFLSIFSHVREKHMEVVRLHVYTRNFLWRSAHGDQVPQIISLDPIPVSEIVQVDEIN